MQPDEIVLFIENRLQQIKMTKGEFYEKSGVSAAVFSTWRTGRNYPSMDALARINATIGTSFGISIVDTSGLTDEKKPAGKTDGQAVELSARTEAIIQLLRAVPREHLDFAYDLLEGSLEAIIRHLPIPAELQSSFRVGSDR